MKFPLPILLSLALATTACGRLSDVGQAPELTPLAQSNEALAMAAPPPVDVLAQRDPLRAASLWTGGRQSLLGDRRAGARGTS